jgi:ATP-dependent exoDNAse (exonuclease V) beta subunit
MGMLETRTLDFENVIILSANEKVLPGTKKQNSLIPLDISQQFGLPNYRSQEATISYHFYRLLQRARKVYFLHVLPSETYSAGEKSRFLHQIEHELARQNPQIRIHHQTVKLPDSAFAPGELVLEVAKSAPLLEHMGREIEKGISPTQMNTYITCSLRYYYSYLSNLKEEEEVQESMSAGTFGNLVHKTLEEIDLELAALGVPVQKEDIKQVLKTVPDRVHKIYAESHPGGSLQNGLNYLLYKVASHVIKNLLEHQLEEGIFPLEILGLEKTLSTQITIDISGKPVKVQLYGRIDRIDKVGNTIRVIDYKTGKVEKNQLRATAADIETTLVSSPEADKVRQLWLYKYILAKRMRHEKGLRMADRYLSADDHQLISGIYSFRNIGEGLLTDQLRFSDGASDNLDHFIAQSEVYLQKILSSMLDPAQPFERTSRIESCLFCPYTGICGR